MRTGHDRLTKVQIVGHIDSSLIGENSSIKFPVRQARMEFGGQVSFHCTKRVEDEEIGQGGECDLVREGGVNEVNK